MEVISYNIWDLPLWFIRNRRQRLLEIARIIVQEGIDIVCLQESWNLGHRKAISDYFSRHGYHDAVRQAAIRRNNGGLLIFSKFPIVSVRFIPFGRLGVSVSEIIGNKGVLESIVETPKGLLRVLNVHLHHQSHRFAPARKMRLRQLRKMFAYLKQQPALPTILAGDFNEDGIMNRTLFADHFSRAGFTHIEGEIAHLPSYRKENRFVDNWINRIGRSQRYDYIFTKDIESLGLTVQNCAPWYIEPPLSDHDPVILTLV